MLKITLNSQSHPLVAEWSKGLGFPLGDFRLEPRFDYFLSFRLQLPYSRGFNSIVCKGRAHAELGRH